MVDKFLFIYYIYLLFISNFFAKLEIFTAVNIMDQVRHMGDIIP